MKIHFIGIGGIGISALAKYYLEKGNEISGSDLASSEITKALEKKGAKIFIGKHQAKNLPKDVDLVVYSRAIPKDNPELLAARSYKLEVKSYPQALGKLTKKYFTIAVSGSHGKGTTTAMISFILIKAGLDPTVILGTKLREFGDSNCRIGESNYLVIEADEYRASFFNYWPRIIVLTNIEKEHMDYFKNLNHILETYKEYISHLPEEGLLVANKDDENIRHVTCDMKYVTFYSLEQKEAEKLRNVLKIPGDHNIYDALAALTAARFLKIPDRTSFEALAEYQGAWRRFEIHRVICNTKPITVVSDYAHHPTEIDVTLKAVREKFPKKKIWVVFQPHQYQRTYYLFNEFVEVLKRASLDRLIVTDIYDVAGREEKKIKKQVSSEKLVQSINKKNAIYVPSIEETTNYLKKSLQGEEVVVIMGAGTIYRAVERLIDKKQK